jgi:hypothetical protein|tara:strand:- start:764 stop:1609 length:846 start_codon:yes stop_codon:yes gene_type:complete
MRRLEDIPDDLQTMFDLGVDSPDPENVERFLNDIKDAVLRAISESGSRPSHLRMSNIGRTDRKLWYDIREGKPPGSMPYSLRIKFLMGHVMEAITLFLIREAGHTVTDEQKEMEIAGVKGHMDARIDGVITDVKTASKFGFRKFESAQNLVEDDPFGYIGQISAYAQSHGEDRAAFLAINKESGEINICTVSGNQMINAEDRIKDAKKFLASDTPPEKCYAPVPEGKSGNLGLSKGCSWCDHKFKCWSDANGGHGLRGFRYSNGIKYLTHVVNPPNVEEVR